MRHFRCGDAFVRGVLALSTSAAIWTAGAFAQTCGITEERTLHTLTGHLAIGSVRFSLTIPSRLLQSYPVTVYPEFNGDASVSAPDLRIDAGGGPVPVKPGASVTLTPTPGVRPGFSITNSDGLAVCIWRPAVRVLEHRPPALAEGFGYRATGERIHGTFLNAGEPMLLEVGGVLATSSANFQVDGRTATVLARTPWQVVLRDPNPRAGTRQIESRGYVVRVPFVDFRYDYAPVALKGRGRLHVAVSGRSQVIQRRLGKGRTVRIRTWGDHPKKG